MDARILAHHWLANVTPGDVLHGDFNGDGLVDDRDASILAANWTGSGGEGANTSVPEPSILALLAGALVCLLAHQLRKCSL
ncbi:MAG: PEP-CTERM sorting domain-containing protein [Pirellulales bacterium]|nr:PEP-CTERM sorting domain-containing protein [Pirellulales bacterium]